MEKLAVFAQKGDCEQSAKNTLTNRLIIEKLLDMYGHPGYMAHKVHVFVADGLEWDPLEMEDGEEIRVLTLSLDEAREGLNVEVGNPLTKC